MNKLSPDRNSSMRMQRFATMLLAAVLLSGCGIMNIFQGKDAELPAKADLAADYIYHIGPGDAVNIFVWRNEDLSATGLPVRPDGKISAPLVGDLDASGKTTEELAKEIEEKLKEYVRDPLVTVSVGGFQGQYSETVRVVGEAAKPAAIPYRKDMTLLDLMIAVGGLTEFADGNGATIVRQTPKGQVQKKVRLEDLIKDGDISANAQVLPGDILIIPEAWF